MRIKHALPLAVMVLGLVGCTPTRVPLTTHPLTRELAEVTPSFVEQLCGGKGVLHLERPGLWGATCASGSEFWGPIQGARTGRAGWLSK